ncbi:MAG TPA: hypothetical protein VK656_06635 [Candidatus Acidoferrum sp.]|nr:hypothetical protein [Candidatus Acidoferrum sp.]
MSRPYVPQEVVDLAHARRDARERRDWATADAYRAQIETAGWRVVDRGVDFDLRPARLADVVADGAVRYGSSDSVPSLLAEPDVGPLSVIVVLDDAAAVSAVLTGTGSGSAGDIDPQVVAVANGLAADADDDLRAVEEAGIEVVRLAARGGPGVARNAGCRRATGRIVLLRPSSHVRSGHDGESGTAVDEELQTALDEPAVAIAGTVGLVSGALPRFTATPDRSVHAVSGDIAFRRADYRDSGPFDERFTSARELDIWWSLTLRGIGEEQPRTAVRVGATVGQGNADGPASDAPETPGQRRDRYRILDAFRGRDDLLSGQPGSVGKG